MRRYIQILVAASTSVVVAGASAQNRAFSVKDDIEMVRFNDPSATQKGATAKLSPDGRFFVIVTSKGLIGSDQIESTMSIFSINESKAFVNGSRPAAAPKPVRTLTMKGVPSVEQTDTYAAVLTDVRWATDSSDLYFLDEISDGDRRLSRLNVRTGVVKELSPKGYVVGRFDLTENLLVFSAWPSGRKGLVSQDHNRRINPDAVNVTGQSLNSILFPENLPAPTNRELWTVRDDQDRPVPKKVSVPPQQDQSWLPEAFAISPKGHWLVQLEPVKSVPADWERYEGAKGSEYLRIRKDNAEAIAADNIWQLKEYSIVNLDTGARAILVNAPQDFPLG
jgi:hypothetical protein